VPMISNRTARMSSKWHLLCNQGRIYSFSAQNPIDRYGPGGATNIKIGPGHKREGAALATGFRSVLRGIDVRKLDCWIAAALGYGVYSIRRFARAL
jgi:hypothetical protein